MDTRLHRFILPTLLAVASAGCSRPAADTTPPAVTWTLSTDEIRMVDVAHVTIAAPAEVRFVAGVTDDTDPNPTLVYKDDAGTPHDGRVWVDESTQVLIEATDATGNTTRRSVLIRVGEVREELEAALVDPAGAADGVVVAHLWGPYADRLDPTQFSLTCFGVNGAQIGRRIGVASPAEWDGERWTLRFAGVSPAKHYGIRGSGPNLRIHAETRE